MSFGEFIEWMEDRLEDYRAREISTMPPDLQTKLIAREQELMMILNKAKE